jgi:putative transposase
MILMFWNSYMQYDADKHHRRSIRLKGWDYSSSGLYFLTICTQDRACLFGRVIEGEMHLGRWGVVVAEEWLKSEKIRQEIAFDAWVIMPNHFHAIVQIQRSDHWDNPTYCNDARLAAGLRPIMRPRSISSLVAAFKAASTTRINVMRETPGIKVWQRNYYESIIRTDRGLERVRAYIKANPQKWYNDQLHPKIKSKW